MDDPDPDPLQPFLVPPPPPPPAPPRSAPSPSQPRHPATDLRPPPPKLPEEGRLVADLAPQPEIDGSDAGPSTRRVESGLPEVGATHQPASPTVINGALKEQAQSLFPELAKDLNRIRQEESLHGGKATSSPDPAGASATSSNRNINATGGFEQATGGFKLAPHFQVSPLQNLLRSRIPASQKGKSIQGEAEPNGAQATQMHREPTAAATPGQHLNINGASDSRITRMKPPSLVPDRFEGGWEQAKKHQRKRSDNGQNKLECIYQPASRDEGSLFFRAKMEGKCYNCLSPNHLSFNCRAPHRCWKCYHSGHRAASCKQRHSEPSSFKLHPTLNTISTQQATHSHRRTDSRSFAEVVSGGASMAMARYPGDPRARPALGHCAVTATGPFKRRREDLVDRAVVCWLNSESHDTETFHLGDALQCQLRIRREEMQVVKHYPENFLDIFTNPETQRLVLDRGTVTDAGRVFHFAPWNERLHAENIVWEFRVKVRVEGIPVHCWAQDVAIRSLGESCTVHYVEERTRRRERTRSFDLWAWCSDPCNIPTEVLLVVTEPDREQPPTSTPFLYTPRHHDDPTDIKRAHRYMLRNHLEVVEDLTFLQGRGSTRHFPNRKARREFIWSYGRPDSEGERLEERRGRSRGRSNHHQPRRDDDDYDEGRGHGTCRHRSLSNWARSSRCRGAVEDCISTTRTGGQQRWNTPHRRYNTSTGMQMVWKPKASSENKKNKKVTFADPIASILAPPKPKIPDDSIEFIKEIQVDTIMEATKKKVDEALLGDATPMQNMQGKETAMEGAETARKDLRLENILKDLHDIVHFEQPVEKDTMEAIKTLIEQMEMKEMKGSSKKKTKVVPDPQVLA